MLKIDLRNMFSEALVEGLDSKDIDQSILTLIRKRLLTESETIPFIKILNEFDILKKDLEKSDSLTKNFDTIVVIGTGGSDLGTRTIVRALLHTYHNQITTGKKIYFAGDTTDSENIADLSDVIELSKTAFIVVSKSGNTIEQSSVFVYFRDLVISQLGEGRELEHFIFLTDPKSGTLRSLADEKGYQTIAHTDVGGRYSVLSSVGMVPAHLVGLNVEEFISGAKELNDLIINSSDSEDFILKYALVLYLYYKKGKDMAVLMPYMYSLNEFAKWFRQLIAESLGKKLDSKGEEVYEGITPIAAYGPADQHSQLQLYNEGPNNKTITFVVAEKSRKDLHLPSDFSGVEVFEFMKNRSFHDILNLEYATTAFALTKNKRPNCTITIPKIDEYHLGQLFYFFELATLYLGYLLDVNPFDQPGVELSKNAMNGVLGKEGYEKEKAEFEEFQK